MSRTLGIDAMGFYTPAFKVEMDHLAAWRGIDPAKFHRGLGTHAMSVCPPDEDTVTMAAAAAKEALRHLGDRRVGLLAVGTETGIDHSKASAVIVHGLLGLDQRCRTMDVQHACYGLTGALQLGLGWLARGAADDEVALVIGSDVSLYDFKSAGEPTQGAGAVAMLLSRDPGVVALEPKTGAYSSDVMDFWRPLGRKAAVVDGKFSLKCYIGAVTGAYEDLGAATGRDLEDFLALDALLYHIPFGKMAIKAHGALLGKARGWTMEDDAERIKADIAARVAPGLTWGSQVGNIYTGSLYLALLSYIDSLPEDHGEKRIGLASYGSGCMAETLVGTVKPGARTRAGVEAGKRVIEQRAALDEARYERWIQGHLAAAPVEDAPEPEHPSSAPRTPFVYAGTEGWVRRYRAG